MKRLVSILTAGLLVGACTIGASATSGRPLANPTPCYSSTQRVEIDMYNQGEIDPGHWEDDGDTAELLITLAANASGYQPDCYYSYTESAQIESFADRGNPISGNFHIRVWVCGSYQGDFSQGFINLRYPSFTTPYDWYDGSCGKQADDLGLNVTYQYLGFHVSVPQANGYLNF